MSKNVEELQQYFQEVNSWVFQWTTGNEWHDIVEGLAPSEANGSATSGIRARDVGELTTLVSRIQIIRKYGTL